MSKSEEKSELKLPRLYFNEYVAGLLKARPDFEAINLDLLYFCLLMKSNQYAKEVYFLRKANRPKEEVEGVFKHLGLLRNFLLDFYEVPEPNSKLIQNELLDPLEKLDSLPLDGEPLGSKLGDLSRQPSLNPSEVTLDDESDGEASPRRPPSLGPDGVVGR
jgi:hypothetical protein